MTTTYIPYEHFACLKRSYDIMAATGNVDNALDLIEHADQFYPGTLYFPMRAINLLLQLPRDPETDDAINFYVEQIEKVDLEQLEWRPGPKDKRNFHHDLMDLLNGGYDNLVVRLLPIMEQVIGDADTLFAPVYEMLGDLPEPPENCQTLVPGSAMASRILARYES